MAGEVVTGVRVTEEPAGAVARHHRAVPRSIRAWWPALRPWALAVAVGVVEALVLGAAELAGYNPFSFRTRYGLYFAALFVTAVAVTAVWLARRAGRTWDADLVPALVGAFASLVVIVTLHGTPYSLLGIGGDQIFRSEIVTRFADTWHLDDYAYKGLPSYYAPLYFWVLGRAAAIAGIAPFHMIKFGAIAVAFVAPVLTYVMWRRIIPVRAAMLCAFVPLILEDVWEPYGWIVLAALIPWWLEAVHGIRRKGVRPAHPLLLGLIGALLFCTYYYFFFVFAIVLVLHIGIGWLRRDADWRAIRRGLVVLGISAVLAAVYWLPLAINMVTAEQFASLNNRWMRIDAGDVHLPMLEASWKGALCLLGLTFLVVTAREAVSRSLLIVGVSLYVWHAIGYPFLVIDQPLMSFRMREMIPVVFLTGAAIALPRIARFAVARRPDDLGLPGGVRLPEGAGIRLVTGAAVLLGVAATTGYVTGLYNNYRLQAAHNQPLPSGRLLAFHDSSAKRVTPPVQAIKDVIDAQFPAGAHPVVLSARQDLFAYYPYYEFMENNPNFSHPAGQYARRLDFLGDLAKASSPAMFAALSAHNDFDTIDVFVLKPDAANKDQLIYKAKVDNFPNGNLMRTITIPRALLSDQYFTISDVGGLTVAVRRA